MILIKGKRYEWPICLPFDGRMANGLFTGRYSEKNGNALFLSKNGQVWSVPVRNCKKYKK